MEKILAVKDATYAVMQRKPDKNEKFRLAARDSNPDLCDTGAVLLSNISRILCILTLPPHIYSVRIQNTFSKIRVVYIKRYAYQSEL